MKIFFNRQKKYLSYFSHLLHQHRQLKFQNSLHQNQQVLFQHQQKNILVFLTMTTMNMMKRKNQLNLRKFQENHREENRKFIPKLNPTMKSPLFQQRFLIKKHQIEFRMFPTIS